MSEANTSPSKLCEALGKEARLQLVELLLMQEGSMRSLARTLGVTPPAIIKYRRGMTHPSDRLVCKMLDLILEYEDIIYTSKKIIISDIYSILDETLSWFLENGLLSKEDIDKLDRIISKYRLSLVGSPKAII